MLTTSSVFSLVGALVGAGAYATEAPVAAAVPHPQQAVADIHRARVEIYCGHNTLAVAGIRAASERLRASSALVPSATFAALDRAAWHARNNHHERAEQALDAALERIAADAEPA